MTRLALVFALLTLVTFPAKSDESRIEAVITAQIEAFKMDDFETAFQFASPTIQGVFGTPERFGMMVRNGFPMVWRPSSVEYLETIEEAPFVYQKVRIRDEKGIYFTLAYQMVETPNGWQINGVQFVEDPALAA